MTIPDILRIEVTQEDIDGGMRRSCGGCPIALAVRRALGPSHAAYVSAGAIDVFAGPPQKHLASYDLPNAAYTFVLDFDNRLYVQPFRFTARRIA